VKLSKTSWIFLIAGVFLILGISLVMTRSQQTNDQNKLQENLKLANAKLALIKTDELTAQQEKLTTQIADYEAQTVATKAILAYSQDSIDTTTTILGEAREQGVDLLSITSPGRTTELLDGNPCETLALKVRIKGSTHNIADFIYSLSKTFPTGVIKSIDMNVAATTGEPAEEYDPAPQDTLKTKAETAPETTLEPPMTTLAEVVTGGTTVDISLMIFNYKAK
jgi:hypothetical protein